MNFGLFFSNFSGQEIVVGRLRDRVANRGVFSWGGVELLFFPCRVQPSKKLSAVKSNFGREISGEIYLSTPENYALNIQTADREGDHVFYKKNWYKVERSMIYDTLIPHCEAEASLLTHPSTIFSDLNQAAEALTEKKALLKLNEYDIFSLGAEDLLTLED